MLSKYYTAMNILSLPRYSQFRKKNMDFYAYMLEELGIEMGVIKKLEGKYSLIF
jgi:antirestriction protein ArdC